jgi:SRSO17 transposase
MDRVRIGQMMTRASVGEGVQIIDDTGFPKKGTHSVGVARQYSGTLGRVDNCQVAVTSHYLDRAFDWPIAARLYLPEAWTKDPARMAAAKAPKEIAFRTKGEIALELVDAGIAAGAKTRAVVADAGYGDQPPFLDGLEARGLPYVVGISSSIRFRLAKEVEEDRPDEAPPPYSGRGRRRRVRTLADRIPSREAGALIAALPRQAWRTVAWREGVKGSLVKRFARVRVYRAGLRGATSATAGWLLGERPVEGRHGDEKYYFAWGLDHASLGGLVELAHARWVIERFYQDAKGELGLDHYEGRSWNGFHRHVALVMLAHSYLTLRQSYGPEDIPPLKRGRARSTTPPVRGFPPQSQEKHGRPPKRHHGGALPAGAQAVLTSPGSPVTK